MREYSILMVLEPRVTAGIIFSGICIIVALLFLIIMMARNRKKLIMSKHELENFYELRQTFIDADESLVYLKDENLKYVFVNKALESFYNKKADEIIEYDDFALTNEEFAQKRRQTDLAVMEIKTRIIDEVEWDGRVYKTTKFPVRMLNGKFGVGAYIRDITDECIRLKKLKKILYRQKVLVDVLNRSFHSRQEQLDYVLHQALDLTESKYGYIYYYDEEKCEFTLNSWTKGVMDACDITEKLSVYQLENTGIWGEVVRQRKPVIVNNFDEHNPLKKGYPEGHVALKRFMSVPVIIDGKIVAVVGLANKLTDYDNNDVYEMILLMNGVWNAVERREKQETLSFERNKYLQTLISIGDGVLVVDKNGDIEMLNHVAEKLTGWSLAEAYGKHYKEIFVLSHEQEGSAINDPIEGVFESNNIQELGNHAILTSRDGTKYCLEDSAAPIKDDTGATVGIILVFRDVTDKKEQRKKIEFLSFHDALTGLYNRRYFEEALSRLDGERNLPLSIIMGDVNGLKLTNDIFGHAHGDSLLITAAQAVCKACRADDIVARWGGDEFVVVLPKTTLEEAEKVALRIKEIFAKTQIRAINGSISVGVDTKLHSTQNISDVLDIAEERMYASKTLEREIFTNKAIDSIINTLHENNPREKEHSIRVSQMCQDMGSILKLPSIEIKKLKEAGYLHDIGKIVLDPKLLTKSIKRTDVEWNQMKKHPIIGYRILNSFDHTVDLAEIVLAHQERWDGSGYPKGLKGEEIPVLSRIIALAESYERHMPSADHPEPMKKDKVIGALRQNAGKHFDPALTEIFINMIQ